MGGDLRRESDLKTRDATVPTWGQISITLLFNASIRRPRRCWSGCHIQVTLSGHMCCLFSLTGHRRDLCMERGVFPIFTRAHTCGCSLGASRQWRWLYESIKSDMFHLNLIRCSLNVGGELGEQGATVHRAH